MRDLGQHIIEVRCASTMKKGVIVNVDLKTSMTLATAEVYTTESTEEVGLTLTNATLKSLDGFYYTKVIFKRHWEYIQRVELSEAIITYGTELGIDEDGLTEIKDESSYASFGIYALETGGIGSYIKAWFRTLVEE